VQVTDAASHTNSAPFTVTIAPPANTAALWLGNADDQLLEYTALNGGTTTTNGHTTIATSSSSAKGVSSLAVDYSGNLWMSSASQATVTELPMSNFPNGTTTTTITLAPQPFAGATPTTQPAGIVFGPVVPLGFYPDSGLWVADSANPAIYNYTPADLKESTPTTNRVFWVNSVLVTYGSGSAPVGPAKFAGLAFDARGSLWVLDQKQSRLFHIENGQLTGGGATQVIEMFVGTDRTLQPQSLAFDASGNLWISFLSQGVIYEYTNAQIYAAATTPEPTPVAQLTVSGVTDSITSIAFDQSGNMWLVEGAAANTGTAMAMIPAASVGNGTVTPTLTWAATSTQLPTSLAWDPAPSNLPLGNVLRRTPAPNASRITATTVRKP
jgi:hypothetical protein